MNAPLSRPIALEIKENNTKTTQIDNEQENVDKVVVWLGLAFDFCVNCKQFVEKHEVSDSLVPVNQRKSPLKIFM